MNFIQTTLQAVEVGKGQILVRVLPLLAAVLIVGGLYNFGPIQTPLGPIGGIFRGLNDAQSMDNAQLARQIVRKQGFTTEFLRPQALAQLRDFAVKKGLQAGDLFPVDRFPPGTPRIIPDTYNAPGYPFLLAAWFYFTHPEFDQVATSMSGAHLYSGDKLIPMLNQLFMFLTAILVFALGRRLFDDRVAWLSIVAFLGTDLVWHYSITALSTSFLMFLVTAALMCILEVFCVGEACFNDEDRSFGPAWVWGFAAAFLLVAACLTRLHLLVLLVPLFLFLLIMPRGSFLLYAAIALIVIGMVTPWFIHENNVSGNPLGSNFTLVLYGQGDYVDNEIFCTTSIPSYEHLFGYAFKKEATGFRWHFEHAWNLLGCNPLIFLFGASILHHFKRRRTRLFHWLLFCSALALIVVNNLGSATPDPLGPWNALILLYPGMVVIGAAFFFILLDRLDVQMRLLQNLIVTSTVAFIILPLVLTLTNPGSAFYAYPPYVPPLIKSLGQCAQPDEWITTDMPWATAWYADRASLWLPDSLTDFQNFYDNVCPTGILILTPVSWSQPLSTFTSGEYKDWSPFATGLPIPTTFPLAVRGVTPPGWGDYSFWSDRPRWQQR
jgi:4-amino-4-deoxy-L-arabinose transferase-like glycosyltransferase